MSVTVSEARASWADVIERVIAGELVTVTRHGEEVAIIARPDVFNRRRISSAVDAAGRLHRTLRALADEPLQPEKGLTVDRAQVLVAELQADRASRG